MKNLLFLALIAMFIFSCGSGESKDNKNEEQTTEKSTTEKKEQDKKYEIESGFIKYKMSMMGMETKVTQYFKDYGKTEATVTEMEMMGQKMKTTSLRKDDYFYSYTEDQKKGTKLKMDDEAVAEGEMAKIDEKTILAQGGKKLSSEELLGKECAVYEVSTNGENSKFWIWKGLMLKMTATQNNMEVTMEATEINETSDFPSGTFDIPKDIEFVEPNLEADFDVEGAQG